MLLRVLNDEMKIRDLVEKGWCPVECSIGGKSITDSLVMDHHGELSHLDGVAVRAYRDHFGARKDDRRFVICGVADADATFAVASLAGILPHPDQDVESVRGPRKKVLTQDMSELAALVNKIDTDPIGTDLAETPHGDKLLMWNAVYGAGRDSLGAAAGVDGWRRITTAPPFAIGPMLAAAKETESARRAAAQKDWDERGQSNGLVGSVGNSRAWGFDVWYGRRAGAGYHDPNDPGSWRRPVVLALVESMGGITIGCPNDEVAEALFGAGGLKNIFTKLDEVAPGWGGREAIGGSPRGRKMSLVDLEKAFGIVKTLLYVKYGQRYLPPDSP